MGGSVGGWNGGTKKYEWGFVAFLGAMCGSRDDTSVPGIHGRLFNTLGGKMTGNCVCIY